MKWIAAIVLMTWSAAAAFGQATQPTENPWPKLVNAVAQSLVDGDDAALKATLADRVIIRGFDGKRQPDTVKLFEKTTPSTLLGAHAYLHPPLVMAADVAADFKTAAAVSDELKKRMIPADDDQMKRANATAVQWLTQSLDAKEGDYVGVLVFLSPSSAPADTDATATPKMQPMFVLFKASETAAGEFKLQRIVYGLPTLDAAP